MSRRRPELLKKHFEIKVRYFDGTTSSFYLCRLDRYGRSECMTSDRGSVTCSNCKRMLDSVYILNVT